MTYRRRNYLPPFETFLFLAMIALMTFAFSGCDDQISNQDIADQQTKVAKEVDKLDAMQERQQFEAQMKSELEALEKRVADLKEKAEKAEGDAQVKLRGEVAELETKCEQMQAKLDELKAASGDVWAQTKIEFQKAWSDMSNSVNDKLTEWKKELQDDD